MRAQVLIKKKSWHGQLDVVSGEKRLDRKAFVGKQLGALPLFQNGPESAAFNILSRLHQLHVTRTLGQVCLRHEDWFASAPMASRTFNVVHPLYLENAFEPSTFSLGRSNGTYIQT